MSPARVHVRITSDPAAIEPVRLAVEKLASDSGLDARSVGEIGLCVNEAIANIIEHAYEFADGKPIELWAEPIPAGEGGAGAGVRVRVRDWGKGVDPSKLPVKPKDPLVPGGLGLICMREMMDHVEYAPQPDGGILLTMTRYGRDGPAPLP